LLWVSPSGAERAAHLAACQRFYSAPKAGYFPGAIPSRASRPRAETDPVTGGGTYSGSLCRRLYYPPPCANRGLRTFLFRKNS